MRPNTNAAGGPAGKGIAMTATGIRKISMTPQMVEDLKDYAWRSRTSASRLVRDILEELVQNPAAYRTVDDTDQPVPSVFTVYVPDELWYAARDTAYMNGRIPLSVLVRKGLLARMEAASDIPASA
jgi:hypothetical protein